MLGIYLVFLLERGSHFLYVHIARKTKIYIYRKLANKIRNERRTTWLERETESRLDRSLASMMEGLKIQANRKKHFLAAVKENEGRKPGPRTKGRFKLFSN